MEGAGEGSSFLHIVGENDDMIQKLVGLHRGCLEIC